jgi:hypothetical protein
MGKVNPNNAVGIIEGRVGDLIFVKYADGRMIVRHRPVREAPFTAGEVASQSHFGKAVVYMKNLPAQPAQQAVYKQAARSSRKRACDLAVADFLNPPVINDIDLSSYTGKTGETISVVAIDDFEVATVCLTLTELNETLIEHGAAVLEPSSSKWLYQAQVSVSSGQTLILHVTAVDRAGNSVTKTVHHALIPTGLN